MRKRTVLRWMAAIAASFVGGAVVERYIAAQHAAGSAGHELAVEQGAGAKVTYVCPMHPQIVSDKPGTCPICGMALVPVKSTGVDAHASADLYPEVQIDPEVINNLGVKLATVRRMTLRQRVETPGFVQEIKPDVSARVTAPFDARVASYQFKPGQWIEMGKPLLTFESEKLRLAEQAHLELLATASEPKAASAPGAMAMPGTPPAAGPPKTIQESRQELEHLGLSAQAVQNLEQSHKPSSTLTLYAPFAGMVRNLQVAEGDSVKAGAILFELAGLMRASVLANAFQRDATWIQPGQPVEVSLPHVSGKTWPGVVNEGAVSIDPNSQNLGIRISFTAPASLLKSAMYVVATIYGDPHPNVLAIPESALIRTEADNRVIVARGGGRFKPVPVKIGVETGDMVEILGGLKEGEQIVVSAQFLIDSESNLQASLLRMTGH